ncbi:MAG: protein yceI precursor [Desulfuromonas sp.]|nr:MAG: protein yceI precursor [Desulfuromonas sp.]
MKRLTALLIALIFTAIPALATASTWVIDPDHSHIGFKIRHMMVSNVRGGFGTFSGNVEFDEKNITRSTTKVTIETASIDTGVEKRDAHLRSADFFDVATYPTMTFTSKKVAKASGGIKVTGDLTLHGVTREVVLNVEGPTGEFKDPWGNTRRGATATTTINRKDFGLNWNAMIESGGILVGEEVTIILEVELIKK